GLLSWCEGGLKTVVGGMCGCDLGHYHVCTISRQSARWFRAIPSRPTQVHYSPEWPLVSLVSLSLGYQVEQTLASPV
ncbi:hypothetical protein N9413_10845, partial [Paracoccaceae bacterium]|nr:hypothetical protein [Paracoccaceae bacterium]